MAPLVKCIPWRRFDAGPRANCSPSGSGVAEVFAQTATKLGLTVVAREYTNDKAVDFTSILTKIRGLKTDAIFFGGYYAQAATLARQMTQLNAPGLLPGGDGLCSNEVVPLGASQLKGRYFCAQGGEPLNSLPNGPAFRARFMKPSRLISTPMLPAFTQQSWWLRAQCRLQERPIRPA